MQLKFDYVSKYRALTQALPEDIMMVQGKEGDSVGLVKSIYWNARWIPIFARGHVLLCVDLDPDDGGSSGKIIFLEDDGPIRSVLSQSLDEFLGHLLSYYERGDLLFKDIGGQMKGLRSTKPLSNGVGNIDQSGLHHCASLTTQ